MLCFYISSWPTTPVLASTQFPGPGISYHTSLIFLSLPSTHHQSRLTAAPLLIRKDQQKWHCLLQPIGQAGCSCVTHRRGFLAALQNLNIATHGHHRPIGGKKGPNQKRDKRRPQRRKTPQKLGLVNLLRIWGS